MRAWALQIISAIREIPSVVWGTVLGASIAGIISYVTTRATNKNSREQLKMQLINDALQRDRERTMALRRDVYLPAAEAIVRAQQALGEVGNLNKELPEIQKALNDAFAATSKIHLVADEATVRAVMGFFAALMPAYFELLRLRIPLSTRQYAANANQGVADRANADLLRTNELMKQFNLSGQTDQAAWARLVRQSEAEQKMAQDYNTAANTLRAQNMLEIQTMARRATQLSVEVARKFPEAVLAARLELGLPIDPAAYQQLFMQQEADVIAATNAFFEQFGKPPGSEEDRAK
jgi:hypothetical protein